MSCDTIRTRWAAKPFAEIGYGGPYFDVGGVPHPHGEMFYFDVFGAPHPHEGIFCFDEDERRPMYPQLVEQALLARLSPLLDDT